MFNVYENAQVVCDILEVLNKYNVKATFFVTNQFSSYQDLIKKEYENGGKYIRPIV